MSKDNKRYLAAYVPESKPKETPKRSGIKSDGRMKEIEEAVAEFNELLAKQNRDNLDAMYNIDMNNMSSSMRRLFQSYSDGITSARAEIKEWADDTEAGFSAIAEWQKGAESSIASVQGTASANKASIEALVKKTDNTNTALAGFKEEVGNTYATTQQFSTFQTTVNNTLTASLASFKTEADADYAKAEQIAAVTDESGNVTFASIAAGVAEDESFIELIADKIDLSGFVTFNSLEEDGEAYINGNNIGLVSDSDGDSTASLRFWLEDDIHADEDRYLIGEIYTSGTDNFLEDCSLQIKTSASNMKITSGGGLDMSSALAMSIESGSSYVEIIADGSVEISSGKDTAINCDYMTILPSVGKTNSRVVDYAWQFFDDGIYYNGYKMVSTPS